MYRCRAYLLYIERHLFVTEFGVQLQLVFRVRSVLSVRGLKAGLAADGGAHAVAAL